MQLLLVEFLRPLTFREMILHTCLLDITFQKKKKTEILQYKIGFLEKIRRQIEQKKIRTEM